jgi:hypothetical protein
VTDTKWALLALIILITVLLLAGSFDAHAQGAVWAHGIVQDETYVGVSGGTVRLDHEHQNQWYKERETAMQGHAFGWSLTKAGNYRVSYTKPGYEVVWIRGGEFTLDTVPTGDILIVVKRSMATATPTLVAPTTLYPPTVDATRTPRPTATANPAVTYIEISAHIQGALMAYTDVVLQEFVPASCFEIAAAERGCPLAVTQSWVARLDGECWRFRPFSCPGGDGIELAARCESPCEVAVIENGYW